MVRWKTSKCFVVFFGMKKQKTVKCSKIMCFLLGVGMCFSYKIQEGY